MSSNIISINKFRKSTQEGSSFTISPFALYDNPERGFDDSARDLRTRYLIGYPGILRLSRKFQNSSVGIIRILDIETDIIPDPDVWGGDGFKVTIPASFTAIQLSKAVWDSFVVTDKSQGRYFMRGKEILKNSPTQDFSPSVPAP